MTWTLTMYVRNVIMSGNYSIPSMEEINKIEKRFTVMSTFSGGGGSCLGYKMAGGDVLVANEFIPEAQNTYRLNFPETKLLTQDIRELKGKDFLDAAGIKCGELDIFDGSPPCSAFSTAGKRSDGWGKVKKYSSTTQRVDDLFFEYVRILNDIQPKTFIAENVKGLAMGKAKGYLKEIIGALKMCGYNVRARILNASNYGVPQTRERLIIIGVRNDINIEPMYPIAQNKKVNLFMALKKLPKEVTYNNPIKCCLDELKILKEGEKSKKYFSLQRARWNQPCQTLTTKGFAAAQIAHPERNGFFTIEERKRIMSLPDDFILSGKPELMAERIGRMVPSLMMKEIANQLYESVIKNV